LGYPFVITIILCGLHWMADAMEVMIMTYLMPAVKAEFNTASFAALVKSPGCVHTNRDVG
jgi:hypothetical protein